VDVVLGGVYVDVELVVVGCWVVVGVCELVVLDAKANVPVRTPTLVSAKCSKSPSEKSRSPDPHPGHSSTICACTD